MERGTLEVEEGKITMQCRWPLEADKGKETGSPLQIPEGCDSANTLILAP